MKKYILSILLIIFIITMSFNTLGNKTNNTDKIIEDQIEFQNNLNNKIPRLTYFIQSIKNLYTKDDLGDFSFEPVDITIQDDAYHNSSSINNAEWWYFDAVLSDGYSVQFSIHAYKIFTSSFITVNFNVYKNSELIEKERKIYSFDDIYLSTFNPLILIDNQLAMLGQYDNKSNEMIYVIQYETNKVKMDLELTGLTKGWKGVTPAGSWAVVLPKAKVEGTLRVDQKNVQVTGIGYHDHNWDVTIIAGLNYGWIWGKTITQNYTITWSEILTTWFKGSPLLVINIGNGGYYNIPAESLDITITDRRIKDGFLIPYGFQIKGNTRNASISIDIKILDSDYQSIMRIVNYWRFHVSVYGTITVDGNSETINDNNIAEYIRFRFY